jgi:hypothetical protein
MSECSVCYDLTETFLSCDHHCCVSCIKKIIKQNSLCPLCRSKFDIKPFKYIPPKHKITLKISVKHRKFLSRFLMNRHFLISCKKQRLYSCLMLEYADMVIFQKKYIHLESLLNGIIIHDLNYLIDCLLWLNNPNNKIYSSSVKKSITYCIRNDLAHRII